MPMATISGRIGILSPGLFLGKMLTYSLALERISDGGGAPRPQNSPRKTSGLVRNFCCDPSVIDLP